MEHPNTHMYRGVILFCGAPPHIGTQVAEKADGMVCKEGHGAQEGGVAGGGWEESEDATPPNKHLHCLGFGLSSLPRFNMLSAEGSRRQYSSQKGSGVEAESIEWSHVQKKKSLYVIRDAMRL
jgi:hypothetical protein